MSKQDRVRAYILHQAASRFTIADGRRAVPGTSDQTIRLVLNACRDAGRDPTRRHRSQCRMGARGSGGNVALRPTPTTRIRPLPVVCGPQSSAHARVPSDLFSRCPFLCGVLGRDGADARMLPDHPSLC
jgi:hypothetical protein